MRERTADELVSERDHYIIDVRPMRERRGVLGFVPGSLALGSCALSDLVEDDGLPVVLYCMSGKRSRELIEALPEALAQRAVNLEGGLLAWTNAGLAVAMAEDDPEDAHDDAEGARAFLTGLRSCFIGQLVETILEFDLDLDPLELFEQLEVQVRGRQHAGSGELLRDLVDHAAHLSRILGTPLDAIAANTKWAYDSVARFEGALPDISELHIGGP